MTLSPAASVAVEAYRNVERLSLRLDVAQRDLTAAVIRMSDLDKQAYFEATEAIGAEFEQKRTKARI